MALAKFAEDIALRLDACLSAIDEPPTHPTILASRRKSADRKLLQPKPKKARVLQKRPSVKKPSNEDRLDAALRKAENAMAVLNKIIEKLEKQNEALRLRDEYLTRKLREIERETRIRRPTLTL